MRPLALLLPFALLGCEPDPTEASVVNDLPAATLEKVWFRTTLFAQPLETGQSSEPLRVGTGEEHAYALVRIGSHAFVARTNDPVRAEAGEPVRIVFSPATSRSICFGDPKLTGADETFITSRVFPGDEVTTDPALCTTR